MVMGLSYRTRFLLELTLVVVTVMSNIIPYILPNSILVLVFTIPSALIAFLFLVDSRRTRKTEADGFRKKVTNEALDILDCLISHPTSNLSCPVWSGSTEGFKTDVLNDEDYALWKAFYDSVEARNGYFRSREGFAWQDVEKFAHLCFASFFKVYDGTSWVKELIPQPSIADLLSRAKRSDATYRFSRNSHQLLS